MDSPSDDLKFHAPSIEELQRLIPAYEIGGFIAQGGMGAVYSARQISLDRPVAIKILPRQFGADPQFRASFEAEAKSMARLNHPNLIGVFDFGDVDGMLYIIMELVDGKSLHHSAHGKLIEQCEAARLVSGICRGLAHAHRAGILHRDIKPGNILLGPGAQPKIGDFGLARPVGQDHNPDEIVWGTPGYSAPEVVEHPQEADHRADIFAVGVLLYELLTGQLPTDPWTPPSRLAKCDPAFDAIIERATQPSARMRYDNAEDLANELDALVKKLNRGVVLRPMGTAKKPPPPPPPVGVRPVPPAVSSNKSKTGTILFALLLIGFLAVGAVFISSANKDDDKTSDVPVEQPAPKPQSEPKSEPKPKPDPKPTIVKKPGPKSQPPRNDPKPKPPEDQPKPEESSTQILARLKPRLKRGELSKLPDGAVTRGKSHYFLVDQPLDWQAASHFAEDHGAQLAVLESADALASMATQFKIKAPVWVGLSDSGMESKWHWVDGGALDKSLWAPGQPDNSPSPDDGQDFAALLPGGTLDDFQASRPLPFLLEWTGKSANEGSIARQLERAGEALRAKRAPIFPAGSRNIGGSRFLLVPQAVSWLEASAMATAAGGHLAVPSSEAEAAWIRDSLQKVLGGGDACWVGGRYTGTDSAQWRFVTGEIFQFVTWAPGRPDHSTGELDFLQVWRDINGVFGYSNSVGEAKDASYFLVEWSAPSRRNMPSKEELALQGASVDDWLRAQRQKSSEQEQAAYERWKRRHDKNVKAFLKDIESETKDVRRFSREAETFVEGFIETIEDSNEIPKDLGNERVERFLGSVHKRAVAKQDKIWAEYEQSFRLAQESYLAAVEAEMKRRLALADRNGALVLKGELEVAAEKNYFLDILSGDFPDPPPPEEELEDR